MIYAALYLEEEADHWYQTVQAEHPVLTRETFTALLLRRFSTSNQENMIGKFNKLVQTGNVDSYISQFKELRGFMMTRHSLHTEDFYLDSFLSGLRPDIQQALYIYKTTTLQEAINKAREQEIFIEMLEKRVKVNQRWGNNQRGLTDQGTTKNWPSNSLSANQPNQSGTLPPRNVSTHSSTRKISPIKRLTPAEMAK